MRSLWPTGGLWRHGDFLKLWSAETISQFGSQVGAARAAARRDPRPRRQRVRGRCARDGRVPPVHPLHAARRRLGRPPTAATDPHRRRLRARRAPATIPIAYVADALTLGQLFVVGFLVGVFQVFFDVAYMSYLPSLVERDQIIEATRSPDQPLGRAGRRPGLGGVLVAGLHRALRRSRRCAQLPRVRPLPGPHPQGGAAAGGRDDDGRKPSMWTELKEGLRFVLGNPNLRAQAGCTATSNLFSSVAFAILLVFAVRELGSLPVSSASSSRSAPPARSPRRSRATRISRRFGIGPTSIVIAALFGPTMLLVAFAPAGNAAIPFLVAAMLIFGFTVVVYNIAQVSYRQAICPPRLQGRMNSVMRFIVWGTIPLGTLLGGALATWIGFRETIVVGAIGGGLGALWLLFSPQRHLREMPEPIDDDASPSRTPPKTSGHARTARGGSLGARARPARVARADREGRAGAHRDAQDVRRRRSPRSTGGGSRARAGAGRTSSSRSKATISSCASTS